MINRVMFWMLVVGTVVVIVSPAYMLFDLSEVNEPPSRGAHDPVHSDLASVLSVSPV